MATESAQPVGAAQAVAETVLRERVRLEAETGEA